MMKTPPQRVARVTSAIANIIKARPGPVVSMLIAAPPHAGAGQTAGQCPDNHVAILRQKTISQQRADGCYRPDDEGSCVFSPPTTIASKKQPKTISIPRL